MAGLSTAAVKWLEGRALCVETALKYGVHSGACRQPGGEVQPDPNGNILVFPYVDRGSEVGAKYRAAGKKFWQREGGRRTFWNADVLDDPAVVAGRNAVVITEGEPDALAVLSAGYPFVVSVPDGAPPVPKGKLPDELEPIPDQQEPEGKYEFLWNNRDRLMRLKRFIIAADGDGPGRRLAAELMRRISAAKCSFIEYPSDPVVQDGDTKRACKDLNEVLVAFGPERVNQIINAAKPYPVRGLYRLSDYPDTGEIETFPVGFDDWTRVLRVAPSLFMVVTGVPSHGKTAWVGNVIGNLACLHGWKTAIFSPEMKVSGKPKLVDYFRRYHIGHKPVLNEQAAINRANAWIEKHFVFIDSDPSAPHEEDDFSLEWVLDRADDAVLRDGIRVLVIDPWNECEHCRRREETMAEYIARAIRMIKRWAAFRNVLVIVVAHPTKEIGKGGAVRTATLYDIEGAAAWFNKADIGIVVERPDKRSNGTKVHIQKLRHDELGVEGEYGMEFDISAGRFKSLDTGWQAYRG